MPNELELRERRARLEQREAEAKLDLVNGIISLAECFLERVELGDDLSWYEAIMPRGDWLAIAEKSMLPGVFYIQSAAVRRIVASLPLAEQHRLVVDRAPIPVAERESDGTITHRMYTIDSLPPRFVRQVFEYRRIRTLSEQEYLPPDPITKPVLKFQPADKEALDAKLQSLVSTIRTGDKRAVKKAIPETVDVLEKIALLVS